MIGSLRKAAFGPALIASVILIPFARLTAQTAPGAIRIEVDVTRAPQKILHAHLQIPVQPGPLVLCYPEWIPGEHMPSGPITNVAGLKFAADGK